MIAIQAAGGVLWRRTPAGPEVAVIHRPRYDDWSLPKGKLDAGEPHLLAALREIREETGFLGRAGAALGSTTYRPQLDGRTVEKTVRWWSVEAVRGSFRANAEVDELRWLKPADALSLLGNFAPLERWTRLDPEASLLVLVRHASAGDPAQWRDDDAARPLDARGVTQSLELVPILACFQPARIVAAPPVRCRETVAPLARQLGLPVDLDPLIGEDDAPPCPELHVLSLAVAGAAVVLCSQGGVIPRVVGALAPQRRPVRAGKGSVWVLTVTGSRFVQADETSLE